MDFKAKRVNRFQFYIQPVFWRLMLYTNKLPLFNNNLIDTNYHSHLIQVSFQKTFFLTGYIGTYIKPFYETLQVGIGKLDQINTKVEKRSLRKCRLSIVTFSHMSLSALWGKVKTLKESDVRCNPFYWLSVPGSCVTGWRKPWNPIFPISSPLHFSSERLSRVIQEVDIRLGQYILPYTRL